MRMRTGPGFCRSIWVNPRDSNLKLRALQSIKIVMDCLVAKKMLGKQRKESKNLLLVCSIRNHEKENPKRIKGKEGNLCLMGILQSPNSHFLLISPHSLSNQTVKTSGSTTKIAWAINQVTTFWQLFRPKKVKYLLKWVR